MKKGIVLREPIKDPQTGNDIWGIYGTYQQGTHTIIMGNLVRVSVEQYDVKATVEVPEDSGLAPALSVGNLLVLD